MEWEELLLAIVVLLAEFAPAFLFLDLCFRYMPVTTGELRRRVGRWALLYSGIGLVWCVAGGWVQWRLAGTAGGALTTVDWIPWWILWRFGTRKQFTFLFKADGGRPADNEKPAP